MNLRIANFNVENLILPDIRYYDRMIFTQEEYDAKANWIASVINRVKPDIIGVQELWTTEALEDVVSRSFHFANGAHIAAPGASVDENVKGRCARYRSRSTSSSVPC
jgi:predicted extracellular nuclease